MQRDRQQRRVPEPPRVGEAGLQTWLNAAADATNALVPQSTFSRDTPESHISAIPGTLGSNIQGGTAWVKYSGDTTTGWVSLATAGDVTKLEEDVSTVSFRVEKGYGGFCIHDAAVNLDDIPDHPSKTTIIGWTHAYAAHNVSSNVTSGYLTIARTGIWQLFGQLSIMGENNTTYHLHIVLNATDEQCGSEVKLATGADSQSCSFGCISTVTAGDLASIKVDVDTGAGDEITISDAQFTVVLLEPL